MYISVPFAQINIIECKLHFFKCSSNEVYFLRESLMRNKVKSQTFLLLCYYLYTKKPRVQWTSHYTCTDLLLLYIILIMWWLIFNSYSSTFTHKHRNKKSRNVLHKLGIHSLTPLAQFSIANSYLHYDETNYTHNINLRYCSSCIEVHCGGMMSF